MDDIITKVIETLEIKGKVHLTTTPANDIVVISKDEYERLKSQEQQ